MNEPILRPLNIGELLDKAFSIYRRRFPLLVSIVAAALIPDVLLRLVAAIYLNNTPLFSYFSQGITQPIATIALAVAISQTYLNKDVSISSAFSAGWKRIWSVWGANILFWLAIAASFLILGFCLSSVMSESAFDVTRLFFSPAYIYLSIRWSLSMPPILFENVGSRAGLRRSWNLTESFFWRVFGTSFMADTLKLFLILLPSLFSNYIMMTLGVSSKLVPVVQALVSQATLLISLPFSTAVTVLIYYDLRIRKEGFDLVVMADEIVADESGG